MTTEIFLDTSGFYALLVRGDQEHDRAQNVMHKAAQGRRGFVTTDYVLDETATLLMARGHAGVIAKFFESVFESKACRLIWMDVDRFEKTRRSFLKNLGKGWSFTDCLSFIVMKELHLREALTKDSHFKVAGFTPLLA
jgi:predicted nucleic acid-binding protein